MSVAELTSGEELLKNVVGMLLSILFLSWILKRLRQPILIAYILAGILLGPAGAGLFKNTSEIATIGSLGLIMQMFFIGAELETPSLVRNVRTFLIGTAVQLLLSIGLLFVIGGKLGWPFERIIFFGFMISLSSSSIILEYLHKNKELHSRLGILTTGILILQDFLIIPMIMILNFIGKEKVDPLQLALSGVVISAFVMFLRKAMLRKKFSLNFLGKLQDDHELQIFVGLVLCFGCAWITSMAHLSAAMGAMCAGLIISQSPSTSWLVKNLVPFRVIFLSLFFFSIGLQIDLKFLLDQLPLILMLTVSIFIINSVINALVFRLLMKDWKNSIYAGALLSQIGEFSLVLCTVAKNLNLVDQFSFQLTLAVISVTMLLTFTWISIIKTFLFQSAVSK
jgi:monovalent cation:H+ antiporter-2, CPA2 family